MVWHKKEQDPSSLSALEKYLKWIFIGSITAEEIKMILELSAIISI